MTPGNEARILTESASSHIREDNESDTAAPAARSFKEALDRLRPELLAMPSQRLLRGVKLDPTRAAQIAEGTAGKLAPHRDALIAEFGERARVVLDALVPTADAVRQTDIEFMRSDVPGELARIRVELAKHHQTLLADARSLATRGIIPMSAVQQAEPVNGYATVLTSVLLLVALFRDLLPSLGEATMLKPADLDAAELVAQRMHTAVAHRDHGVYRAAAADLRTRALTKLVKDYDTVRKMVTFIRWDEGDADELAPSFWAAPRRRRGRPNPGEGVALKK